jgi:hypothetical protein
MTCEERVRQLVVKHESLYISDLVAKSGFPEPEVRAVLARMEKIGEGHFARDIIREADYFTRSLVGTGQLVIERRLAEMAWPDRLNVKIERIFGQVAYLGEYPADAPREHPRVAPESPERYRCCSEHGGKGGRPRFVHIALRPCTWCTVARLSVADVVRLGGQSLAADLHRCVSRSIVH